MPQRSQRVVERCVGPGSVLGDLGVGSRKWSFALAWIPSERIRAFLSLGILLFFMQKVRRKV